MERRPDSSKNPPLTRRLRSLAQLFVWSAFLIGCAVIYGWVFDLPILTTPLPNLPSVKLNTALCIIFASLAIGLTPSILPLRQGWRRKTTRWVSKVCVGLVIAITSLTLIEHGFHVDFGIDQLLIQQPEPNGSLYAPGRMAPNTALAFLVLGTAWFCKINRFRSWFAQNLVLASNSIAGVALLGYLYGNVNFLVFNIYTGMAVYTAIALLMLNAAVLCLHPGWPIIRLLSGSGAGSKMVRRLLPLAIVPILSAQLGIYGHHLQLYTAEAQDVLQASLDFALIAALIAWAGSDLNRLDAKRKREEARSAQLAAIVEASEDAIISKTPAGIVTSWNRGAERLFGYMAEEMVGQSITVLIPPELQDEESLILAKLLQGEKIATYETLRRHSKGQLIPISLSVSSLRDQHGRIIGISKIARDISDRKQAEEALRKSNDKLAEAQRVAHIGNWEFDVATQKILWSEEVFRIFGRDPTQPEPSVAEHQQQIHPDDFAMWQRYSHQMLTQGQPLQFDFRILLPDGVVRYIESCSESELDRQGRVIRAFGTVQDITERKSLESQLRSQLEKADALSQVVQTVRNSLDLNTIFQTAAIEIGRLLHAEHSVITRYSPQEREWHNIAEYRQRPEQPSMLGFVFPDADNPFASTLHRLEIVRLDDPKHWLDQVNGLNREAIQTFPGVWLMVPLCWNSSLWGSMGIVRPLGSPLQDSEVELAKAIADQLAIAIHQSELHQQVQQLNATLEQKVTERTALLQRAYDQESLLKRITDQVRDSLDETQILQTAVQELGTALDVVCCDTGIYDLEQSTSQICYEYTLQFPSMAGTVVPMSQFLEVYNRLLQGQALCFCILPGIELSLRPDGYETAILACPIQDDQGVWGDLWLHKPPHEEFTILELRLVQQVAAQCAIALRQSRLYQAVQAQVADLARLNAVKDDFLSMVSHELRAPMANIKMAAQMLEIVLRSLKITDERSHRYLEILQDECFRETSLINDLLDLSRLETERTELDLTPIDLSLWLPHILESFQERTISQQQELIIDLPPELPTLSTDSSYLERIMTELLHNACKYTPAGEKIIVSGQVVADQLQLCVTNTGVEIAEPERDRVFEKFYRIPHHDLWKHGGTGLGLALIKKMIERLGASIQLESSPGYVTFTLRYPLG